MRKSWTWIAWGDWAAMTMKCNEEAFKRTEIEWLLWLNNCIHLSAYTVHLSGEFYLMEIIPQKYKKKKKKTKICISSVQHFRPLDYQDYDSLMPVTVPET